MGHEYTEANLQYAAVVMRCPAVLAKQAWAAAARQRGAATVPTTIEEEVATSPFMGAALGSEAVLAHARTQEPWEAMKFVREEKSAGSWKSKV